jgi:glucosamine kinase
MILIADSGSTSTDWKLLSPILKTELTSVRSKGLNPFHKTLDEIIEVIKHELIPYILPYSSCDQIHKIYFYGSGCSEEGKKKIVADCLKSIFTNAMIIVDHDTMASAIACCGDDEGIACILGTGSNSCVYDGKNIIKTLPSLGYMLGDEGSGSHIGKGFLQLYLKNKLSKELEEVFYTKYKLTASDVLDHLYRKEKPGTFISGFAPFVIEHQTDKDMQKIIQNSFHAFFDEFILPYPESKTFPINFVGSIASLLSDNLRVIGKQRGYKIQRIVRYPIESLAEYHLIHL